MIKRIQIENFKSFGKLDLEPHPKVNLLIGPNSSGKSNFLEAISKIEINGDKLVENPKLNRKSKKTEWKIRLDFENLFVESIRTFLSPYDKAKTLLRFYNITNSGREIEYETDDEGKEKVYVNTTEEKLNAESAGFFPEREIFFESHFFVINQEIKEYRLSQQSIGNPFLLEKNTIRLYNDFSNISGFIYSLVQEDNERYNLICDDLFKITKEFDLLKTPISKEGNGKIELAIRDSIEKRNYLVNEVSEGISYFIAILCLLHQPNPPKVILLEEPENGIHPRRIIEIYRLIWKLAEEKDVQFFITTHSPILLNQFSEYPECVWVFDKVDGITQVKNLEKDILEPRQKKLIENGVDNPSDLTDDLGENWMMGLIDGVPSSIFPEDY
jgi:predicted ATPase